MKISINGIKTLIDNMGFIPQNGTNEVYFNTNKIEYRSNDIDEIMVFIVVMQLQVIFTILKIL